MHSCTFAIASFVAGMHGGSSWLIMYCNVIRCGSHVHGHFGVQLGILNVKIEAPPFRHKLFLAVVFSLRCRWFSYWFLGVARLTLSSSCYTKKAE